MDFLRRNAVKFAFIAIIVFFALPFIYGNEEDSFSPFAVKSGMSYQANPISRLADRIASFYGIPMRSNQESATSPTDTIKNKVAKHPLFNKENSGKETQGKDNVAASTFMASAKKFNDDNKNISSTTSASSSSAYQAAISQNNSNSPYKGTVNINGKDYKVIEDIKGDKYVVTSKGHVPYADVLRKTVSQKEFLSTKKLMPNASDIEILEKIRAEKVQQLASSTSANSQNYQAGYRNGSASSMGSNNVRPDNSLKTDKGFDDNFLSNAYDDLKNINIKVEQPESSGGGSSTTYYVNSGGSKKGGKEGKGEEQNEEGQASAKGKTNGGKGGGFSAKDVYNDTLETVQNQREENKGEKDQEEDAGLLTRKATLQAENRVIITALTNGQIDTDNLTITTEEISDEQDSEQIGKKLKKLKKSIKNEKRSIYVNPNMLFYEGNDYPIIQALFKMPSGGVVYNTTNKESTIKINNTEDLKNYLMSKLEEIDKAELAATQDLAEAGTGEKNETI